MGKARQRFPPSLDETVETLQSLFGLIDKPTGAGGNNGGGVDSQRLQRNCSVSLPLGPHGLFRCLSMSPSSSLQIIFFCFSISIISLEIATACRLCPSFQLRLQHLRRIFGPWLLISQEPLDAPPPRRFPSAQVSILGGGQDQDKAIWYKQGLGLKADLLEGCGKGSRDRL